MSIGKKNIIKQSDWYIPIWLKLLLLGLVAGTIIVLIRTLSSSQDALLGVDIQTIQAKALTMLLVLMPFAVAFWLYPHSAFSLFCYWCMRFLREQIYILSLVGVVYLFVARAPVLSLRGGILYVALLFLFSVGCYLKPAGLADVPHPALERLFLLARRVIAGVEPIPGWALRTIVVLLPVAVICLVIYFVLGSKFTNYGPYSFWNDEVAYWVWLRSFVYSGFNSGYNAPNELLPVFEYSRYGEASPFYIYIYGSIGKLIGWFPELPILINFALLTVAICLFMYMIKLDNWQVVFTGLVVMLTWPVLIYLPLTTHETLNQVIGILLAITLTKNLLVQKKLSIWSRVAFVVFVYLATLVRLSWGLMLFPVLFYCLNGNVWRRIILAVVLGGALYVSAVLLTGYLLPPVNNSILRTFADGFSRGPKVIKDQIALQFYHMLKFKKLSPNIVVVFQMIVIAGWGLKIVWDNYRSGSSLESVFQGAAAFQVYSMVSLLIAGFTFYIQVGFYRTFAPVLLIVYLWYVIARDYRKLSALLLVNIIFFPIYMTYYAKIGDYRIIETDYSEPVVWGADTQMELEKFIVYHPDAKNPWCNTLLIPLGYYDSRLTLVPPGIGISYILDPETYQLPIKSGYVMFDQATYDMYIDRVNLELLVALPIGDLYRNRDVDCSTFQ